MTKWITLVALLIVPAVVIRWNRSHREVATLVKLQRVWEWQLPAGPRIVAVQDPGSGDDAVWIDGLRAAAAEEGSYTVPLLAAAAGDPYRAVDTQHVMGDLGEQGAVRPSEKALAARSQMWRPYRAVDTHAKLVFPADGTCWLTIGGKRVEPVRTSSDVA